MTATLEDLVATEEAAKKTYGELMSAKTKEVEALTKAIEEKTIRIGDLGVSIAQMKEDLDDTAKAMLDDKKFLQDLDKNCAIRKEEWAYAEKMVSEELLAIADTIKILNDDDALELFKKTLPTPALLQLEANGASIKGRALGALQQAGRGD